MAWYWAIEQSKTFKLQKIWKWVEKKLHPDVLKKNCFVDEGMD